MHAWELAAEEIDFGAHSALVAVGGDGTAHEVINGVLNRRDKLKLPICFVPNGSGNDLVGCLGVKSVDQALEWLVRGDLVKMDVNKVLLDYEDEADIPETENRAQKFRYSVINAAVGYIAKVTHLAVNHKPFAGKNCYITAATVNFFSTNTENFDLIIEQPDGSRIELPNEESLYLLVQNGKYGGGRCIMCPPALLNDGLLDVCMQHGPAATTEIFKYIKHCLVKKGGHIYKENYACFRGKAIRIVSKT